MTTIDQLLSLAIQKGVSDVHLCSSVPSRWRLNGQLLPLTEYGLFEDNTIQVFHQSHRPGIAFNDDDFAFNHDGSTWRANASETSNGPKLSLRLVPNVVPLIEQLGLPKAYIAEIDRCEGLHLVTGPTGSGKTTTLTSIIRYLAKRNDLHIITLEDPIEQYHIGDYQALITQREYGKHFTDWKSALKMAMRQDPDVILIGEMRDRDTMKAAISAAETGHMVFGTLHNQTAPDAITRVLDTCADDARKEHAAQVSKILSTVLAQQLVRKESGGRVPAIEYLQMIPSISSLIREGKYSMIKDEINRNAAIGMRSMNTSLAELVRRNVISRTTARQASPDPKSFDIIFPQ